MVRRAAIRDPSSSDSVTSPLLVSSPLLPSSLEPGQQSTTTTTTNNSLTAAAAAAAAAEAVPTDMNRSQIDVGHATNDDDDAAAADDDDEAPLSVVSYRRNLVSLFLSPVMDEQGKLASIGMGLITIFVGGTLLGWIMPKESKFASSSSLQQQYAYATLSSCLGYTYFLAWSVSFYPQVVTNFRRKSTAGLSVEFSCLNVLGFACYSIYNVTLYFSHAVQELYRQEYGKRAEIPVQSNDVAFALHALILSCITLGQIIVYNNNNSNRNILFGLYREMSLAVLALIGTILLLALMGAILCLYNIMNWLDYVYVLSLCKIVISTVKYVPQVYLNWQRRSTVGWSIWQILLDLTGGLLSNLQLVLDCVALQDFSGITGNVAKLLLGQVSIFFDVIFCLQHYVLYPASSSSTNRPHPPRLLASHESQEHAVWNEGDDENAPEVLSTLT